MHALSRSLNHATGLVMNNDSASSQHRPQISQRGGIECHIEIRRTHESTADSRHRDTLDGFSIWRATSVSVQELS